MLEKFFEHKKSELIHFYDALGDSLPPIFKFYAELVKKADPITHSFTCSVEKLSERLGRDPDDVETDLIKLAAFHMIDIKIGYKDSARRKITLHVY